MLLLLQRWWQFREWSTNRRIDHSSGRRRPPTHVQTKRVHRGTAKQTLTDERKKQESIIIHDSPSPFNNTGNMHTKSMCHSLYTTYKHTHSWTTAAWNITAGRNITAAITTSYETVRRVSYRIFFAGGGGGEQLSAVDNRGCGSPPLKYFWEGLSEVHWEVFVLQTIVLNCFYWTDPLYNPFSN